jgi:hypothetical protein
MNKYIVNRESLFNPKNITNITIGVPFRNINGWFENVTRTEEAIRQDIRAFIFTNKGERIMRPDFGTNIKKYIFEPNDQIIRDKIIEEISEGINKFFPYVKLISVNAFTSNNDNTLSDNEIKVEIKLEIKIGNEIKILTIDNEVIGGLS